MEVMDSFLFFRDRDRSRRSLERLVRAGGRSTVLRAAR
jgi:hypothetical protein